MMFFCLQVINNKKALCLIYEDAHYFKFLFTGPFDKIPEKLKNRTLENICIQYEVVVFYVKPLPAYITLFQKVVSFCKTILYQEEIK
jgi:hypothetical protein